jgi:hypothetical protein
VKSLAGSTILLVFACVLGRSAAAAPAAGPDPVEAPPSVPATALDQALRQVLESGCREGLESLAALAASGQPDSALAAHVVRICAQIRSRAPDTSTELGALSRTHPDRGGRAQLVLATTLYGIWAGISVDVLADVGNDRLLVMYPLLGMAAGLGGSLYATGPWDVSAGQAWAIITGLDYGTYNGLLWSAAVSSSPTAKTVFGAALPAGLAGGAIGIWVAGQHPNPGSVELVRSGGLYGTAAALMSALLFVPDNGSSRVIFTTLAIGMDVGLATGAGVASHFDVARNRILLIDAGTIAGLGFGLGGTWLVTGSHGTRRRHARRWRSSSGPSLPACRSRSETRRLRSA